MKKYTKLILIGILALAFFLRFHKLSSVPALNADEAAIGYNAYSLIQTGLDEHGNPWPIHFQSFNDYKPGLYFYIVMPFVKFMGLNVWSVRIPGALIGVLSVLVVFLLVDELFKRRSLSLLSAFFLAISPWHIQFSRGGWEVNTATFLMLIGTWLFVKGRRQARHYITSFIFFALSMYTYHAARVVVPLLGLGLLVIYRKEIRKNIKGFLVASAVGLLVLLPLARDLTSGAVLSRAAGVGLFADPGPINRINEQRGQHSSYQSLPAELFHNKFVNYSIDFLDNYSKHFWGEFLFMTGDSVQRDKVPETGEMYLFDIIFLVGALYFLTRVKETDKKSWHVVIWWLIVSPVAAALTFQSPHALRAQNMVIPLSILSAFGLIGILFWVKSDFGKKAFKGLAIIFALVIAWNFARYLHMYYVHMAKEYPFSSQYGVKELVNYVQKDGDKYKDIVVTDRYDQPYILFLFYLNYPPAEFQKEHTLTPRDEFGFSTVRDFGKYHFYSINFDEMTKEYPHSLIVGTPDEIPQGANIIKRIYGTNGYEYFDVVAN